MLGRWSRLTHIAISQGVYIQHADNSSEKVLGIKKLHVDGCGGVKKQKQYLNMMAVITTDMNISPSEQTFHLCLNPWKELKKLK